MAAIGLRPRGVYAPSDEEEVIAVSDGRGGYLLYTPQDWNLYPYAPAVYEVYASRQIHHIGQPTARRIEDLMDTGRTAGWHNRTARP